jgi:methylamine dehydrogenase heavy chain
MIRIFIVAIFVMSLSLNAYAADLPIETIPSSETLPETYPDTWVFAHDFNFNSLLDGKVLIVDVAAETRNFKGIVGASAFASFQHSKSRPELYSAQSFFSRGTYGERTDTVVIFDKASLNPIDEIVIPSKRQQVVTQKNSFQLSDDERMGLLMNFTPAASVVILDLVNRKILGEVAIPGCNFVFPTGERGFSTLCSDGTLASYALSAEGSVTSSSRSEPFIDIDKDPIFVKNAIVGGVTYFPSFRSRIQPVDFRSDKPQVLDDWNMVPANLRKENWRPSGWHVIDGNDEELFVLMQADGKDGSHKDGGTEVWVFEPESGILNRRINLGTPGVSIAVTRSKPSYLVVTNANMFLDVYATDSGSFLRTITTGDSATPMVVHAN